MVPITILCSPRGGNSQNPLLSETNHGEFFNKEIFTFLFFRHWNPSKRQTDTHKGVAELHVSGGFIYSFIVSWKSLPAFLSLLCAVLPSLQWHTLFVVVSFCFLLSFLSSTLHGLCLEQFGLTKAMTLLIRSDPLASCSLRLRYHRHIPFSPANPQPPTQQLTSITLKNIRKAGFLPFVSSYRWTRTLLSRVLHLSPTLRQLVRNRVLVDQ